MICGLAIAGWIALSPGLIDPNGKPIGTDFSNVYAAGTLTWQGHAADAYDPALQHKAEMATFGGRDVPFYGWHYPPFFFAVAFLVAALPYGLGLAALARRKLCRLSRSAPRDPAAARDAADRRPPFPPSSSISATARTDSLTTALLGGALCLIDRRPWLAGVLIGLLAYKPQFGVLIPIALLANQRWSSIAAAGATVAALVALSFAMLGGDVWHAFRNSMNFTQTIVLEQGGTGWEKIQVGLLGRAQLGRRRAHGLRDPDRAGPRRSPRSHRLALAQRRRVRAEGLRACDRKPARDALRARLRSRRARRRHRLLRAPRF